MSPPILNRWETVSNDLKYMVTHVDFGERFEINDIVKMKIFNITEERTLEGNYYLSPNIEYCEVPYSAVRLIAQNVKYGCKFNIECSSKYIHNNNFNDNTTYNLEVEILRNLTDQRHGLLDTYAKERQIEGNMQYGKSYYKKAIKHYRNALGILGLHDNDNPEINTPSFDIIFKCLNNLSACYMQLDDYENALQILYKVKILDENNIKMLWRTGRACLKLHRLEEARASLLRARELDPESSVIRRDLREVCKKLSLQASTSSFNRINSRNNSNVSSGRSPRVSPKAEAARQGQNQSQSQPNFQNRLSESSVLSVPSVSNQHSYQLTSQLRSEVSNLSIDMSVASESHSRNHYHASVSSTEAECQVTQPQDMSEQTMVAQEEVMEESAPVLVMVADDEDEGPKSDPEPEAESEPQAQSSPQTSQQPASTSVTQPVLQMMQDTEDDADVEPTDTDTDHDLLQDREINMSTNYEVIPEQPNDDVSLHSNSSSSLPQEISILAKNIDDVSSLLDSGHGAMSSSTRTMTQTVTTTSGGQTITTTQTVISSSSNSEEPSRSSFFNNFGEIPSSMQKIIDEFPEIGSIDTPSKSLAKTREPEPEPDLDPEPEQPKEEPVKQQAPVLIMDQSEEEPEPEPEPVPQTQPEAPKQQPVLVMDQSEDEPEPEPKPEPAPQPQPEAPKQQPVLIMAESEEEPEPEPEPKPQSQNLQSPTQPASPTISQPVLQMCEDVKAPTVPESQVSKIDENWEVLEVEKEISDSSNSQEAVVAEEPIKQTVTEQNEENDTAQAHGDAMPVQQQFIPVKMKESIQERAETPNTSSSSSSNLTLIAISGAVVIAGVAFFLKSQKAGS